MTVRKVRFTTPGAGTWTVPSGVHSVTANIWSAATHGTNEFSPGGFAGGGQGGAGGQWARRTIDTTPGDVLDLHVGIANGSASTGPGTPASPTDGDSYFGDPTTTGVFAQGAYYTQPNNISHGGAYHPPGSGLGGTAPFPWEWNDGGNVENVNAAAAGSGGGGAGGPNGPGGIGRYGGGLWEGAGGGGAANGGSDGNHNSGGGGFSGLFGGAGGNNRLSAGSGAGSSSLGAAASAGTAGGGGGGGYGAGFGNGQGSAGGAGSTDDIGDGIYGPGSGGGGGGGGEAAIGGGGGVAGAGGNGGQFGGGGGGSATSSGPVGQGGQGLIVITYEPEEGRGVLYRRVTRRKGNRFVLSGESPDTAPTDTGAPFMSLARVGVPIACSPGSYTGTAPIVLAYETWVDGAMVSDTNDYVPLEEQVGLELYVVEIANNVAASIRTNSNTVTIVNPPAAFAVMPGDATLLADAAALNAVLLGDPATVGGADADHPKHYKLAASTSFSYVDAANADFSAHPIHIWGQGGSTADVLNMQGAKGINWHTLDVIDYDAGTSGASIICQGTGTSNQCQLTFDRVRSIGSIVDGTQTGSGYLVRYLAAGSYVTITGHYDPTIKDIQGRGYAIAGDGFYGTVLFEGMTSQNLGVDASIFSNYNNITINKNHFSDLTSGVGDHPDCIQFFAHDGERNSNVTITNNTYQQGSAVTSKGSQGYFLVTIDNLIVRGNVTHNTDENNSISVSDCTQVVIDDNYVSGWGGHGGTIIWRDASDHVTISNNFYDSAGDATSNCTNVITSGNHTISPTCTGNADMAGLDAWLADHPDNIGRV
jgi:hypothetical protein